MIKEPRNNYTITPSLFVFKDHNCSFYSLVKPKKNGKEHTFIGVTAGKRKILQVDASVRPWSTRPGIQLRGISKQMSQPNFIHELVDLRLMTSLRREKRPFTDPAPVGLTVDIRKDARFQLAGGSTCLQTGSRVYFFDVDRCGVSDEHLRFQGWGGDVDCTCFMKGPIQRCRATLGAGSGKRGRHAQYHTCAVKASGNAVCLPDYGSIIIPLVYVMNADYFARPLERSHLSSNRGSSTSSSSTKPVTVDPESMTSRDIRNMRKEARGRDLVGEDSDCDADDCDGIEDMGGDID